MSTYNMQEDGHTATAAVDQATGFVRELGLFDSTMIVVGSMIGLVTAGTQFSVEQMQNAAAMFRDPKGAMGRVKESIDNLCDAMQGKTHSHSTTVHAGDNDAPAVNGRKA